MENVDLFPLMLSIRVALISTVIVTFVGVALAYLLARRNFFGREVVDALFSLPLVLPPTVLGYYLLVLLGRSSPVGRLIENVWGGPLVFTWQAAVVAAAVGALPLMVKTARASFSSVERDYEDAARTLGKSEWQVFRRVTLPLALRGVTAGAALAFARALGDFGATLMVAGNIPGRTQTAAVAIYDATQSGRNQYALLLVVVLSLIAFTILYLTNRLIVADR